MATSAPVSRAIVSASCGESERLDEHGRDAVVAHELGDALQIVRARLRLGRVARDRNLVQVVRLREMAERRVARDDVAPFAVRQPIAVLASQASRARAEFSSAASASERRTDGLGGDLSRRGWDRARRAGCSRRRPTPASRSTFRPGRCVERRIERRTGTPAQVENDVGLLHSLHVVDGQLVVVRLHARGSEVRDRRVRTGDLLGGEGERIEGRDDAASPDSAPGRRARPRQAQARPG